MSLARRGAPWAVVVLSLTASWPLAAQVVTGRVISSGRQPVEHARVEAAGSDSVVYTDLAGVFELSDVEFPTTLTIGHPRFEITALELDRSPDDLVVVLQAKQSVYETIAVSANRGQQNFAPVSVASSVIEPEESAAPITHVSELLAETPAVSENGQAGAFQTFSIRGISRQRVLTLVDGMRVVGERRAGVSASFVDPLLLGSIDVVRGPGSTYYGSGALGGVVQLFPRRFDRLTISAGFESGADEGHIVVAGGNESASWSVASRRSGNAETPNGELLFTQFRQTSGSLRRWWERNGLAVDLGILGSLVTDIGKSNTDFPQRTTIYPEERHVILRLGVERPAVWELLAALHPNSLETRVEESGSAGSELLNEALDVNLSWQRRIQRSGWGVFRLGVDYFGRRGVDAHERLYAAAGGQPLTQRTLDDAEEDELGLFGAWERNWGPAVIIGGGRLAWQRQQNAVENAAGASADDTAITAFAGLVLPVADGFELTANAGTGLRFPSLSERFFTGTTGRGFVVGNQELEPERALNLDAGLRFYGERLFVAGYLFRNDIDDYVERVELAPERLTFVNLSSGRIEGVEVEGLLQLPVGWSMSFGGHTIKGRDDDDEPLADVPADRLYAGVGRQIGDWGWRVRWEARAAKDDPGSGEKAIPAADLVSGRVEYLVRPGLKVLAGVRNVLDEAYFNAADRKVPLAPGRSVSLGVRWQLTRE